MNELGRRRSAFSRRSRPIRRRNSRRRHWADATGQRLLDG